MKHFIVLMILVGSVTVPMASEAMVNRHCDCVPSSVSAQVLDILAQPVENLPHFGPDAARWERAQAVAERDREYSALERQRRNDQLYDVASHLIDAQFDVSNAEIDQVVMDKVHRANRDLTQARGEIDKALYLSVAKQRPRLTTLWDQLLRTDLVTTLCHGQDRAEDHYQYEKLKTSFRSMIRVM